MSWERKPLGEIINLKRGYDLPSQKRKYGLVPIISSSGITDFHSEPAKTGEGVITGRYGTLGQFFYINGDYWPLNTTLYVQDFKGNIPRFIYYFLKTLSLEKFNAASAVPGLDRNVLHKIEVNFTSNLPTQRKIASILSAYDDLIENNLKRVKLLEEKAFLRYKGIIKDEQLVEMPILEICYITDGTHDSPKQQREGYYLVTGKHLIGGFIDFSSAYFISEADHDKIQKRSKVVNGDLVLSNIGTLGNVAIIDSTFEFSVKNVIIFKPNSSVFTSFLYCYLNSDEMQKRFQQESSGTSQRFISLTYTRNLKVKLPSEMILMEFHQEVSSLLKLKSVLNQQNTKLREQEIYCYQN